MAALLTSLSLFAFAWILHFALWRYRLPRHQMLALVCVFAFAPFIAGAMWLAAGRPGIVSIADVPAVGMAYFGAMGCYLIAYTAVEETSPSLAIVRALEAAGSAGCSAEELSTVITESNFVRPRLEALRRDGMLAASGSGFVLTPRGRQAARIAVLVARIFNIHKNA